MLAAFLWSFGNAKSATLGQVGLLCRACFFLVVAGVSRLSAADAPRIVNIYNFVRENDFRIPNSKAVLYQATLQQVRLLKGVNLPATFALQYDALLDTNYQDLFLHELPGNCEIGAWWEIPQALVERAGLNWRGQHEWDPAANVGFSPGYTPAERRKLVDTYMADFKRIFGHYPKSVGSWYLDEVTLEYLAEKYGVVASCNCKDQIGTDGYTLWGGYWNQAYYPSRLNAYMPAQTQRGQIGVPIFRMLGSDPIYQHGTTPGMFTLEPVYRQAGGSADWVAWFLNNLINQPPLAFAYTQAGQENSFGWQAMKTGFTLQVERIAAAAREGKLRVETLQQSGEWFRHQYSVTPPTAVIALDDWKHQNRKTVWYDSRFYRLNVLWQDGTLFVRDLHCFDERIASPTHDLPLKQTSLAYETLPIVDWAVWSHSGTRNAGMWPVLLEADGSTSPLKTEGMPTAKELDSTELSIEQPLTDGGIFSILCSEKTVTFRAMDGQGKPLNWAYDIVGGPALKAIVDHVGTTTVSYSHSGVNYRLKLGSGSCREPQQGSLQLRPNAAGKLVLKLDKASLAAMATTRNSAIGDGRKH